VTTGALCLCYHDYSVKQAAVLVILLVSLVVNAVFVVDSRQRSRVSAVPDGDSLDLADGRRIRLLGIDAPERGRCMADEARARLIQLAGGKRVRLKDVVKDDFGRQLAMVIVEDWRTLHGYLRWKFFFTTPGRGSADLPEPDPLLQRGMVSGGLARSKAATSNPYYGVLKSAQEIARSRKLGIWSDACRSQLPVNQDCTIKGNVRQGKKFFYPESCRQYEQVVVDTAYGDRWFCSSAEGLKAGFTPAPGCTR